MTTLVGLDIFDVADWKKFHRIKVENTHQGLPGGFPWSAAVLDSECPFYRGKAIRETHAAFLGLRHMTIMRLETLYPEDLQPRFYVYRPTAWYQGRLFASQISLAARWYLLLRDAVPFSDGKVFKEQKAMLPEEYEVPSAVAEVAKDLFVFQKTGRYANPKTYARTADHDLNGERVYVGYCDTVGIELNAAPDEDARPNLCIAASRKLP